MKVVPAAEPRGEDLARRIEVTQIGAREAAADVAVALRIRGGKVPREGEVFDIIF